MKLYRYINYSELDAYDNLIPILKLNTYNVFKETPKGYWFNDLFAYKRKFKRWVSKTAKERFAYPTQEEALFAFKKRKLSEISILQSRLSFAKKALILANNHKI